MIDTTRLVIVLSIEDENHTLAQQREVLKIPELALKKIRKGEWLNNLMDVFCLSGGRHIAIQASCPVEWLGFNIRATNALKSADIEVMSDLLALTARELRWLPNLGAKSVEEIRAVLKHEGLTLKGE